MKERKEFPLIEAVIVVAILAIIASVVIPNIMAARIKNRVTSFLRSAELDPTPVAYFVDPRTMPLCPQLVMKDGELSFRWLLYRHGEVLDVVPKGFITTPEISSALEEVEGKGGEVITVPIPAELTREDARLVLSYPDKKKFALTPDYSPEDGRWTVGVAPLE